LNAWSSSKGNGVFPLRQVHSGQGDVEAREGGVNEGLRAKVSRFRGSVEAFYDDGFEHVRPGNVPFKIALAQCGRAHHHAHRPQPPVHVGE
jgi:hypothetical protein